jgi:hypothetical protein
LDDCVHEYEVPGKGDKPALRYTVDISFSSHCFTRGLPGDGAFDRTWLYGDRHGLRLFDVRRYQLSRSLPGIISGLLNRKCMHTGHGNFFTVELLDEGGMRVDYDIFFTASRSSQRGRLNLFVQSAFVRDKNKLPSGKPIRFAIILFNVLNGKPIRD